jgi:transposase
MVHLTETCDKDRPRIVTNVQTTPANVHEATRTATIHEDLADKDLTPTKHIVDSEYMDADHVIDAKLAHNIHLVGPMRKDNSWQSRTEGGYTADRFAIDWEQKKAVCPEGKTSRSWGEYSDEHRGDYISVRFSPHDCQSYPAKHLCTRSHPTSLPAALKSGGRGSLETDELREQVALELNSHGRGCG